MPSVGECFERAKKGPTRRPARWAVSKHQFDRDGIAVGSGYVYRGKLMPQMVGKYLFTDIASGRLFYTDLKEMLDARATTPAKVAQIGEIQIVYQGPGEDAKGAVNRRMFDIVADAFLRRGGVRSNNCVLPDGSSGPNGLIT